LAIRGSGPVPDIVIIGGGILGCALAFDLAGHGLRVELLERRELAREASWASAGIISPATPSYGNRAELALLGYRRYPGLVAEVEEMTGLDTGFHVSGELMLAGMDGVSDLRALLEWQQDAGIRAELLEGQALREYEPALHPDFAAGVLTPDTGSIRLDKFTVALARAAQLRGATISEFTTVTGIVQSGGRVTGVRTFEGERPAGGVVVAAGAWSGTLLESLDVTVPTHPVRGQMMAISNPPIPIRSVIAGGGGYFVPRADGTVAIGATEEPDASYDARVTPSGIGWLIDLVDRVAPSLNDGTLAATWAGLRPGSGDGDLIVGRLPHLENAWVATGHFRSGALLGPSTSEVLAGTIATGEDDQRLAAFTPARFM